MKALTFLTIILLINTGLAQNINDEIIEIQTTEGSIVIQLDGRRAPITVRNDISQSHSKFYDSRWGFR